MKRESIVSCEAAELGLGEEGPEGFAHAVSVSVAGSKLYYEVVLPHAGLGDYLSSDPFVLEEVLAQLAPDLALFATPFLATVLGDALRTSLASLRHLQDHPSSSACVYSSCGMGKPGGFQNGATIRDP